MKERDEENGQILAARLEDLLKEFRGDILTGVDERLSSIQHGLGRTAENNDIIKEGLNISNESNFDAVPFYVDGNYPAFMYAEDGSDKQKFWHVPKDFVFPKVNWYEGWKFWLLGIPEHHEEISKGVYRAHPIMPFRFFDVKLFPKIAKNALRVNWHPVFKIMEGAIPDDIGAPEDITLEQIEELFVEGTKLLQERASYCFKIQKHQLWNVSTWSKKVSPSQIMKFGTEEDKLALPAAKKSHSQKSRESKERKRPLKEINLHARRCPREETKATPPASPAREATPPASPAVASQDNTPPAQQRASSASSLSPTSPSPPPRTTKRCQSRCPPDGPPRRSARLRPPRTITTTTLPVPLTEDEEKRVMQLSRQDSLEEAVQFALTHMRRRCKEAGEEPTPITELEKLAVRHRNASSSSATRTIQSNSAQHERQSEQDGSSSESEDKVYEQQFAHSDDESDERVIAEFEGRR